MAFVKGFINSVGEIEVDKDVKFNGVNYSHKKTTLTNAQIKVLTTPVQLVPAPGAGKWLEFVSANMLLDYGSNALAEPSAPDDMQIIYDTVTTAVVSQDIDATGFITATADTRTVAIPKVNPILASSAVVNKGLYIWNSGGNYTGNTGNDTVVVIDTVYRVHEV